MSGGPQAFDAARSPGDLLEGMLEQAAQRIADRAWELFEARLEAWSADEPLAYSKRGAADKLGISVRTVERAIECGHLRVTRPYPTSAVRLIERAELFRVLEAGYLIDQSPRSAA